MTQRSLQKYLPVMDDAETKRIEEEARAVAAIVELGAADRNKENVNVASDSTGISERLTESDNTSGRTFNPVLSSTATESPVPRTVDLGEGTSNLLNTPPKGTLPASVFDSPGLNVSQMDMDFEEVLDRTLDTIDHHLADMRMSRLQEDKLLDMDVEEQAADDVVVEGVVEETLESDNVEMKSPEKSPEKQDVVGRGSPMNVDTGITETKPEVSGSAGIAQVTTNEGRTTVVVPAQPHSIKNDYQKLPKVAPPFAVELITKYDGSKSLKDLYTKLFSPYVDISLAIPIEAPGQNLLGLIEMVVRHRIMEILNWNPTKITKCSSDDMICFNSAGSPLSQWHKKKISLENKTFCCNEQYMMYKKAILFNDTERAAGIMLSDTPAIHQSYGRHVDNFDQLTWDRHKILFVYAATWAKFAAKDDYTEYLIGTYPKVLLETSNDAIWGTGHYFSPTNSAYLPEGKGHLYGEDRPIRIKSGNHYLPVATNYNMDHKLPEIRKIASLAKTRPCGATLQKFYPGDMCIRDLPGPWDSLVPALQVVTAVKYPDASVTICVMGYPAKVIIPGPFYDEVDLTVPVNYQAEEDYNMRMAVIRARRAKDFLPLSGELKDDVDPYANYGMVVIQSPLEYPNNELYQDYDLYDNTEGLSYDPNYEDRARNEPYMGPVLYSKEQYEDYNPEIELKIGDTEERYDPDDITQRDTVGMVIPRDPVPGVLSLQEKGEIRNKRKEFVAMPMEDRDEDFERDMTHVGYERQVFHNSSRRGSVKLTVNGVVRDGDLPITSPQEVDLEDKEKLRITTYNLEYPLKKPTYRPSTTEKRVPGNEVEQLALMGCYYEEYRQMPHPHNRPHLLPDGGEIRNGDRTLQNMLLFYEGGPCPLVNYVPVGLPEALSHKAGIPIGCKCPVRYFDTRDEFEIHWNMYHCTSNIGGAFCLLPNEKNTEGKGKNRTSVCPFTSDRNFDLRNHLEGVHKKPVTIKDFGTLTDCYFICLPSLPEDLITPASMVYAGPKVIRNKAQKLSFLAAWVNLDPYLPDPRRGDKHVPRLGTREYQECKDADCLTLEELKTFKDRQGSVSLVREMRISRENVRKGFKRTRARSIGSNSGTKRMVVEVPVPVEDSEPEDDDPHVENDPLPPSSPEDAHEPEEGEIVENQAESQDSKSSQETGKKSITERLLDISKSSAETVELGQGKTESIPFKLTESGRKPKPMNKEIYNKHYLGTEGDNMKTVTPWQGNPEPFDAPHWEWREFFHKAITRQGSTSKPELQQHNLAIGHILRYKRFILKMEDNMEEYDWFLDDHIKLQHAKAVVEGYRRDIRTITMAYNIKNVHRDIAKEEYKAGHQATRAFSEAQYIKHKRAAMDARYYFLVPHAKESLDDLMKLAKVFVKNHKHLTDEMVEELLNRKALKGLQDKILSEIQNDGERIRVRKYDYLRWESQFEEAPFGGPDKEYNTKRWGKIMLKDYQYINYTEPTRLYKLMAGNFIQPYWKTFEINPIPTVLKPALLPQNPNIRLYQAALRQKQMLAKAQAESQRAPYEVDTSTEVSAAETSADEGQDSVMEIQEVPTVMAPGIESTRQALSSFIQGLNPEEVTQPQSVQTPANMVKQSTPQSSSQSMDTSENEQSSQLDYQQPKSSSSLFLPGVVEHVKDFSNKWKNLRGEVSNKPPVGVPNLKHFQGIQLETVVVETPNHPSEAKVGDIQPRHGNISLDANWHMYKDDIDFDTLRESMSTFTTPLSVEALPMNPEFLNQYRSDKNEDDECWSYQQLMEEDETIRVPVDNDMRRFRARFGNHVYKHMNADEMGIRNTYAVRAVHDLVDNIVMPTTRRVQYDQSRIRYLQDNLKICRNERDLLDQSKQEVAGLREELEKANKQIGIERFHTKEQQLRNEKLESKLKAERETSDGLVKNVENTSNDLSILQRKYESLKKEKKEMGEHVVKLSTDNEELNRQLKVAKEMAVPLPLRQRPEENLGLTAGGDAATKVQHPPPISINNLKPLENWDLELREEVRKKFGWINPCRIAPPIDGVYFYEHEVMPTHVVSMDGRGVHFTTLPTTLPQVKGLEADLSTRASAFSLKKIKKIGHQFTHKSDADSDE